MTADNLICFIAQARSFEHLKAMLEAAAKQAAEEAEAADREWNTDSLGQD